MYPTISRHRVRLAAVSIVTASVLAACGSTEPDTSAGAPEAATATTVAGADPTATDEVMTDDAMAEDTAVDEAMTDDTAAEEAMTDDTAADVPLAAWQTIALTGVDGASFTLADFRGTPVFVETFATWCPKCKDQLKATNAAAQQLGSAAVFIAVSVETGLSNADVADYAADNGFDAVRFAVLTPEALAAFVEGLGQSAANPPSTPKVVIDATGVAGELTTGFESADDIVAKVTGQS